MRERAKEMCHFHVGPFDGFSARGINAPEVEPEDELRQRWTEVDHCFGDVGEVIPPHVEVEGRETREQSRNIVVNMATASWWWYATSQSV